MFLLLSALAWADDTTLEVDAQVRPRVEADSVRGEPPGVGPVLYATQRSRLAVGVVRPGMGVHVMLNDVRTWGEETDTRRDYSAQGLDLREARLEWGSGRVNVELGRFERGLYTERLLAVANWRQAGRSFDGAIVTWYPHHGPRVEARAYAVRAQDLLLPETDQAAAVGQRRALGVLTAAWETEDLLAAPMIFVDHDAASERLRGTAGAYASWAGPSFQVQGEGYVQLGREGEEQLLAGLLGLRADWIAARGRLGLGYDLQSGDADPTDSRQTGFNTLYGANHRYYGNIDVAQYYVGGGADDTGLHDAQLRGRWDPTDEVQLGLDLHGFVAAVAIEDRLLAVEPDLYFKVKLASALTLSGGANLWLAPVAEDREWMGWLMLDARMGVWLKE